MSQTGKYQDSTVVITGANRGIGLELASAFKSESAQVIGVCRTSSEELDELADMVIEGVQVDQPASVAMLKDRLSEHSIDILVNNAGILEHEVLGAINYESVEAQFRVNALAPLQITEALLERLNPGAKLAFITSRMGSISDNGSGSYYGYRMSKAALNAAAKSLSHDLSDKGISVAILHPGFVQTAMVGYAGDISPAQAASRLMARISELNPSNSGTFWHSDGQILPW